jgi:hypothetical protein
MFYAKGGTDLQACNSAGLPVALAAEVHRFRETRNVKLEALF